MTSLVVVDSPGALRLDLGVTPVVAARDFLATPDAFPRRWRVYNLCRSFRYQSLGYYVSLLAMARGHRVVPDVAAIQDMKAPELVKLLSDELDGLLQKTLRPLVGDEHILSVYFGRNLAKRYARLASRLFALFEAPLLRARFRRQQGHWGVVSVRPIALDEVPDDHLDFLREAAEAHFASPAPRRRAKAPARYELGVLVDPDEAEAPSSPSTIKHFARIAKGAGLAVHVVDRTAYPRLAELDALFIRTTTRVDHFTYRFSRRAAAEGLVVVDDPESIVGCSNKVFLAELLARHRIPTPKTTILHRDNLAQAGETLGFPCVLKLPDSAFSMGVKRADDVEELLALGQGMLQRSDLIVAQAFVPTKFDWRIGLLGGEVLWACRYHMAPRHWQIASTSAQGRRRWGEVEAIPVDQVPAPVRETAIRAAALIGNGLYGVDLKETDDGILLIEVNDNPNLERHEEDAAEGDRVYERVVAWFLAQIEARHPAVRENTP